MKSLLKTNVISKEQFDDAQATLRSAEAELDLSKSNYNDGALTSPIDGVLDRLPVDEGEHNPGRPDSDEGSGH